MRTQARHRYLLCAKRRSSWSTLFQRTSDLFMTFMEVTSQSHLQKLDTMWKIILIVSENKVQAQATVNGLTTTRRVEVSQTTVIALIVKGRRNTTPKSTKTKKSKYFKKNNKKSEKTSKKVGQTKCCEDIILTHPAGCPLKPLARCNVGKVLLE